MVKVIDGFFERNKETSKEYKIVEIAKSIFGESNIPRLERGHVSGETEMHLYIGKDGSGVVYLPSNTIRFFDKKNYDIMFKFADKCEKELHEEFILKTEYPR